MADVSLYGGDILTAPPAPTGYAATNITQSSMRVNFDANGNGGDTVIEWQCLYSIYTGQDAIDYGSTKAFKDYVDLTGLSHYTTYYIYARGRNSVGWGPYSNRITAKTLPNVPQAPFAPTFSSLTQTSIVVRANDSFTWEGATLEREIGYGTDPNTVQHTWTAAKDTTAGPYGSGSAIATITGLSRYTQYYFWARIRNDAGWGPWSARSAAKTLSYAPGMPTAYWVGAPTQTSFQFKFVPNDTGGDSAINWQIAYSVNSSIEAAAKYINNSATTQVISGLSRSTIYYVWVRGINSGGNSPWSARMAIQTLAYVPAAPSAPNHSETTQVSSRIYFTDASDNGGAPVIERRIGWSTNSNSPTDHIVSSTGNTVITDLPPGKVVYFWAQTRNRQGWSAWSARTQITMIAGARVRVAGVWHQAVPYVRYYGVWRVALPYVRTSGVWKKSG